MGKALEGYVSKQPVFHGVLPSGYEVSYRKPQPLEWIGIWGNIPSLRKEAEEIEGAVDKNEAVLAWKKPQDTIVRFSILPKITTKSVEECDDNELPFEMLSPEDIAAYMQMIVATMVDNEKAKDMSDVVNGD